MKWQQARKIFEQDPWFKYVLFHDEWRRTGALPAESLQESIVDHNVTHMMFRSSFNRLRIDSRPVYRTFSLHSAPMSVIRDGLYDDFADDLGCEIGYFLVAQMLKFGPPEIVVEHLSWTADRPDEIPNRRSIRWAGVKMEKKLHPQPHRWLAVVRNVSIISRQSERLVNGYDVFKCPGGFNPFSYEWNARRADTNLA